MSGACNVLSDVSNVGGIAGLAVQGAIGLAVGYRAIFSPHVALQETWEKLGNIRIHLKEVTPERRERIEAAAAMKLCRSLTDIETNFRDLWCAHAELSEKYEQSSYVQRHFGKLRQMIHNFDLEVRVLLLDTWATTRAQTQVSSLPPRSGDQSNSMPSSRVTTSSGINVNHEAIEMTPVSPV